MPQTKPNTDSDTYLEADFPEQGRDLEPVSVPGWQNFDWLRHGFSNRSGGVSLAYAAPGSDAGELNLGFTAGDLGENVHENRRRFLQAVAGDPKIGAVRLATIRQVHSNRVSVVGPGWLGWETAPEADGLMTREPGVLLGILTADCIPVLVVDPIQRAVAGFHAGWRGTVERIVELGVQRMREEFHSEPDSLFAAIGPGIGGCCYTVGEEVIAKFRERFDYAGELFSPLPKSKPEDRLQLRLDLTEANRRQLLAAGLKPESIAVVGGCTACHPERYYSHRASQGNAGRMMAVVGIR